MTTPAKRSAAVDPAPAEASPERASRGAPVLEAVGVHKRLGALPVLEDVSLALHPAEVVAVLGPNGAGKSTLVRVCLGLDRPDRGSILFRGRPLADGRAGAGRIVGLLQRAPLFSGTVGDNVAYGLRVAGVSRLEAPRRIRSALARLGIEHLAERDVRQLSGGESQRVAIARATVLEPDVLVLDEPASDLDVATRRSLLEDLEAAVRSGSRATLLVTHDPREAFALADRVVVLEAGRVSQEGTPADLVAAPASPFVAALTGAELVVDGRLRRLRDGLVEVAVAGGGPWLAVPATDPAGWPADAALHVAYRPEDVVLVAPDDAATSTPRNRTEATVATVTPQGGFVRVRLSGAIPLVALVTRDGADALGLRPGCRVAAHIKAVAARAYLAGPGGSAAEASPAEAPGGGAALRGTS